MPSIKKDRTLTEEEINCIFVKGTYPQRWNRCVVCGEAGHAWCSDEAMECGIDIPLAN